MKQSWSDTMGEWKHEEQGIWLDHFQKLGFKRWEDWRWSMIKTLGLDSRTWEVRKLENPVEDVRQMHANRLTRWREFCTGPQDSTFDRLADHPFFVNHERVQQMRRGMPRASQLIGLTHENQTMLVDGHHRAVAMARMSPTQNRALPVYLAHAEVDAAFFEKLLRGDKALLFERKLFDVIGLVRSKLKNISS